MTDVSGLIHRCENLVAVPSAHFDPLFAQAVRVAIREHGPTVVAIEASDALAHEWCWVLDSWPMPVVLEGDGWFVPFVPGDSIVEALRLACRRRIPVAFVDLWLEPDARPRERGAPQVGVDLAPLLGPSFTRMPHLTEGFTPSDLAREAHMARRLRDLMTEYSCVLWVGGAAHWERIVHRLERGDFIAPRLKPLTLGNLTRMRLGSSALARMTGRLSWHVRTFAEDPDGYDEDEATRALALQATHPNGAEIPDLHFEGGPGEPDVPLSLVSEASFALEPESKAAVDVGRVLLYARNLALARGLRQRATFHELLTSATSVIGPAYAAILHLIAMADDTPLDDDEDEIGAMRLPTLTWETRDNTQGYACDGEWITAEPLWPAEGQGLRPLSFDAIIRKGRREEYRDIAPANESEDERYWKAHPDDSRDYQRFVEYVLRRASLRDPETAVVEPFVTGLGDGIDVRATLRAQARGDDHVHVRREESGRLRFTNGVIDWRNDSEQDDFLQGHARGGWIDPSYHTLGSATRERADGVDLAQDPFHLQRNTRDFSLVTLDLPTVNPHGESFYDKVILPLVKRVDGHRDTVYDWLRIMFKFCAGKPFSYYSRYVPSHKIHAIAAEHGVSVVHYPLHTIPKSLRAHNRSFRFMALAPSQWEALRDRLGAGDGAWGD